MKKIILCMVMGLLICLCGCSKDVSYTTKYITNCETTEFRQKPSNASMILYDLSYGEAVSFENDAENGYSKVIHNGVSGYVLSTCLTAEKPEVEAEMPDFEEPDTVKQNDDSGKYNDLISNQGGDSIEEYISTFVRPLYNEINENIDTYSTQSDNNAMLWFDSNGCVKKELEQGENNYNMSRQYYYNSNSGEMVFAFVFKGTQEHRLYFKNNKLVRYIDAAGNIIDNPTSTEALEMAAHALYEAY